MERVRIDKWLWAARFFRSRSLSTEAIDAGRVRINGERVKPARELKAGDRVELRAGRTDYTLIVKALSDQRGSATLAQTLYDETPESRLARERAHVQAHAQHRQFAEPAEHIVARPTKKDRRKLDRFRDA